MSKLSDWLAKKLGIKEKDYSSQVAAWVTSWLTTNALAVDNTLTSAIVAEAGKVAPGVPAETVRAIASVAITKITNAAVAKAGTLVTHDPASP